ncbi:MAG: twin-arginine translocase TatA/TatE family subunit [Lachnospiraceae bacterium]|nr:twin-arginine translocase TatA/TatE family subunit [Lachnospiraceae bacterium]
MLEHAITMSLLHRLGFTEILIILVIVFVLFGPKYLPKISKKVGQSVRDWQQVGDKVGEKAPAPDGIVEVEPVEVVRVRTIESADGEPVSGSQGEVIEVIDIK